jgi:YihY family inner membrane protein
MADRYRPRPGLRTGVWNPSTYEANRIEAGRTGNGNTDSSRSPGDRSGQDQGKGKKKKKTGEGGKLVQKLDAFQRQHNFLAFPFGVVKKFGDDQAGYLAALVAYYAFFSLFPLLLVFVTVLGFVLGNNPELQDKIVNSVISQFPIIGDQIKDNVHSISGNGIALAVGIGGTLLAGLGVIQALQHGMEEIWGVPRTKRPNFLWSRIRALMLLAVLGVSSLVSVFLSGIGSAGGQFGGALKLASIGASLALNFALFMVAFRVLTTARVRWKDVAPGALVAAVAWAALQSLGTYIVGNQLKNASATYGLFALVIGLLSWLYLGAQITHLAAEINVVKARKLWPRSLKPPLTDAEQRALSRAAKREALRPEEDINVAFEQSDQGGARS